MTTFISALLLLFSTFIRYSIAGSELYVLLFPSFARPLASNPDILAIRLVGVVYQYADKDAITRYCEDSNQLGSLCSHSLVNFFAGLGSKSSARILEPEIKERMIRFIAKSPQTNTVSIRLSLERPTDIETWSYGSHFMTPFNTAGLDINVELDDKGMFNIDIPLHITSQRIELYEDYALNVYSGDLFTDPPGSSPKFWLSASIAYPENPKYRIITDIPVTAVGYEENEIQIITDVDDTTKLSNINHGVANIINKAFYTKYEAVPGMAEFFKQIALDADNKGNRSGVSFHFLSAAPWSLLVSYVNEFVRGCGFPWASFTPRSLPKSRTIKAGDIMTIAERTYFSSLKTINGKTRFSLKFKYAWEKIYFEWKHAWKNWKEKMTKLKNKNKLKKRKDQEKPLVKNENYSQYLVKQYVNTIIPVSTTVDVSDKTTGDAMDITNEDLPAYRTLKKSVSLGRQYSISRKFKNLQISNIPLKKKRSFTKFIGPKDPTRSSTYIYKVNTFETLTASPAFYRMILIGDSGEYDPEIYRDLAIENGWWGHIKKDEGPGRIQCVLIRFAPPKDMTTYGQEYDKTKDRIRTLYGEIPHWEDHVRLYTDGFELQKTLFIDGSCHSKESQSQWNIKK